MATQGAPARQALATLARLSGWLYIFAALGFIVASSIRSRVIASNSFATTAEQMRDSSTLVRIGLLADLMSVVLFLLTAVVLYLLLARVDAVAAALTVIFVTVGVPMGLLAIAQQFTAVTIAVGGEHASALAQGPAEGYVALLAASQADTRAVHELIAGLSLLPLGYLVLTSGFFPGVLGVLLVVGGFSWLLRLGIAVLAPQLSGVAAVVTLGAIGEVIFMVWLVTKGTTGPATG